MKNKGKKSMLGLEIHLVKYGINKVKRGLKEDSNIVLGHYDSLSIKTVNNWFDFSVDNTITTKGSIDSIDEIYAKDYSIKLLFPDKEIIKRFSEFNYTKWQDYNNLLENNDCLTLTLVNLTDTYKKKAEEKLLENFLGLLLQDEYVRNLIQTVNFVVLPSLGYSDFCFLTCDKKWKCTMNLIDHLHGLTYDKKTPVLSTDYMIPVYKFNNKNNILDNGCFNDIGMSVRVNLRPGITAQTLKNVLPENVEVYRTSGSTDCLLRAKGMQTPNELFNFLRLSSENEMDSLIVDMESTLQLSIDFNMCESQQTNNLNPPNRDILVLEKLYKQINEYYKILRKNDRHLRQLNNLYELYTNVKNIYEERHTDLVCSILEGFISNFSSCLNLCIEDANKHKSEYPFDEIEKQVSEFCNIVNEFLLNLSRSDCFFIEKERHNHSSVSATASLLIAYNQWFNAFSEKVIHVTQSKSKSDFKFLITSGNQDETVTFNPFYFLNQQNIEKKKLSLIIRMPENSSLDFTGTILRFSHECMHFCGERYRKERLMFLISFVARMLSNVMACELFAEKNICGYVENICSIILDDFNEERYELLEQSKHIYKSCLDEFENTICEELIKCLNESEVKKEKDRLLVNVEQWMYNSLLKVFSIYKWLDKENAPMEVSFNDFFVFLYEQTQKVHMKFYQCNAALFSDREIDTLLFELDYEKTKLYSDFENEYGMDFILKNQIQSILAYLTISRLPYYPNSDVQDFPSIYVMQNNISDILEVSTDIFSETFSDVMACKILNVSLVDYLLAQTYEDSDIINALPVEPTNYFRFSAVIYLCFSNELSADRKSLKAEACKEIEESIICLKKHGKSNLPCSDDLCNRISEFLTLFQENFSIGQYLYDYLKYCIDKYTEMNAFSQLEGFADSFSKIRLLDIAPQTDATNEKIINMYYSLIYNNFDKGDGGNGRKLQSDKMYEIIKEGR